MKQFQANSSIELKTELKEVVHEAGCVGHLGGTSLLYVSGCLTSSSERGHENIEK